MLTLARNGVRGPCRTLRPSAVEKSHPITIVFRRSNSVTRPPLTLIHRVPVTLPVYLCSSLEFRPRAFVSPGPSAGVRTRVKASVRPTETEPQHASGSTLPPARSQCAARSASCVIHIQLRRVRRGSNATHRTPGTRGPLRCIGSFRTCWRERRLRCQRHS
jgi:hypothetical protein